MRKIKDLSQLAARGKGEEKNRILQKILDAHDSFIKSLDKNSDLNYNIYFQQFVDRQVYQRWKELWHDLPLRFVVFDDFIVRYPEAEQASYAITRLLELLRMKSFVLKSWQKVKLASKRKKIGF